jgi:N6-L-threonylcarbamoyladenine synthase
MYCLGIETSCDDTSIALLEYKESNDFVDLCNSTKVLASKVSSQIKIHENYGGVIPELGARYHTTNFLPVLESVLLQAEELKELSRESIIKKISFIAVTVEPGLSSALKVGIEEAKALKYFFQKIYNHDISILSVNHLHGHIASSFLEKDIIDTSPFPHLHLLVSGGNTQIIEVLDWGNSLIIGKTIDDAVGECFDKTARMIGIKYPGGVKLAKIAALEDCNILSLNKAMQNNSLNTSFSGLKTQIRYLIQANEYKGLKYEEHLTDDEIDTLIKNDLKELLNPKLKFIKELCISIQSICTEQLERKFKKALELKKYKSVGLSGGVSANLLLRSKISNLNNSCYLPHLQYAAMIAFAGILSSNLSSV